MNEKDITIVGDGAVRKIMALDNQIGEAVMSDCGSFMFNEMPGPRGLWEAWVLRAIADRLDEINKPWRSYMDYSFTAMRKGEPYMSWDEWVKANQQ